MKKTNLIFVLIVALLCSCSNNLSVKEKITKAGTKINLKSQEGLFWSSHWDLFIYANKDKASDWEEFTIKSIEGGKYVLQAYTKKYLSAEIGSEKEIESNRDKYSTWEMFDIVEINDSIIALKADNGKYLTVAENLRLYAIADTISSKEQFLVSF